MGEQSYGKGGPTKVMMGSQWLKLAIFLLVILFGCLDCALSWEGDLWYFTSFKNVSEWAHMYPSCDIKMSYKELDIPDEKIPFTLSPISLPKAENAIPVNQSDPDERRVLVFLNNPPPATNSYIVSFGFQKNKECITQSEFSPCLVSPSFGKIRVVTLTAVREPISHHKTEFSLEPPEKFVTLVNGGSKNERKFHEAIFLGNYKGSDGYRSTHTVDGKSYPMEIYMYFVDEVVEVMSSATILVVLVEEQEEDNHQIKPIVNAVSTHLYKTERKYLKKNEDIAGREQMYHHLKESKFRFKDNPEDPPPMIKDKNNIDQPSVYDVPSSEDIERKEAILREAVELFQAVKSDVLFLKEDYLRIRAYEYRFTLAFQRYGKKVVEGLCVNPQEDKKCPIYVLYWSWVNYLSNKNEEPKKPDDSAIPANVWPNTDVYPAMKELKANLLEFQARERTNPKESTLDTVRSLEKIALKVENSLAKLNNESAKFTKEVNTKVYGAAEAAKKPFYSTVFDYRLLFVFNDVGALITSTLAKFGDEISERITPYGFSTSWKDLLRSAPVQNADQMLKDYYNYKLRFEDNRLKKRKFKRTGEMRMGENLGLTEEEYEEYENLSPTNESLRNRFQISWLLPKGGGYYYYKGSSPVPPCYQAHRVIVFKKPIKMSKEQIKTLTTMPTHFAQTRKIKNTLGRIHPLRRKDFPIYFEKRNHQFLRDDGYHKNSIFEAHRRRLLKKAKGHSTSPNVISLIFFLICAINL